MTMFPKLIAKDKVNAHVGLKQLWYTIQTMTSSYLFLLALYSGGFIAIEQVVWYWQSLGNLWVEFIVMALLMDYPIMWFLQYTWL